MTIYQEMAPPRTCQSFPNAYHSPRNQAAFLGMHQGGKVPMLLQFSKLIRYTWRKEYSFFHFPHTRRQEAAESKLQQTNPPYSQTLEGWNSACRQGMDGWCNCSVLPSGKIDSVGVCWGKGEAVGSIRTWKIMKPTNLLSITGSYFNCTGRLEK